jgi:hypothetical protein
MPVARVTFLLYTDKSFFSVDARHPLFYNDKITFKIGTSMSSLSMSQSFDELRAFIEKVEEENAALKEKLEYYQSLFDNNLKNLILTEQVKHMSPEDISATFSLLHDNAQTAQEHLDTLVAVADKIHQWHDSDDNNDSGMVVSRDAVRSLRSHLSDIEKEELEPSTTS